ncbi:hypothetical protein ZIOFF_035366 [Zingiber officinale]|uniref:Uncharacterized protein n=1 Tax=Zingiber officinale TaxID=94328 RepID=A0A8J5GGU4_ZINOF|nr:hypothetical protein ZIOFF_035366 [Zingiber officinale]
MLFLTFLLHCKNSGRGFRSGFRRLQVAPSPLPLPPPPPPRSRFFDLILPRSEVMASRRAINPSRRASDSGSIPLVGSLQQKSRSSPLLSIGLVVVAAFFLIGYALRGSGGFASEKEAISIGQGASCSSDVIQALPILKKAYGDSMRKVLHVGPDSCAVISKLLKEEDSEAWGVEPYDLEDTDSSCKSLMRKGFVRVSDLKFPLPYRPKSFSLAIVSDSLDYLSPKYLNKTLPDLARLSADGLVIFAGDTSCFFTTCPHQLVPIISVGYPGKQRAKVSELAKFGKPAKLRSSSWWIRYFVQTGLQENEMAIKKFEEASTKNSYKPSCQIFHVTS